MPQKKPSKNDPEKTESPKQPTKKLGAKPEKEQAVEPEFGGVQGPEPTRYGDWEHGGRCSDF